MATLVADRRAAEGRTGGRTSSTRRARRPLPATRAEAASQFEPAARIADWPAVASRIFRMNRLGLLHPEGRPITNAEAHQAILDALYPEG